MVNIWVIVRLLGGNLTINHGLHNSRQQLSLACLSTPYNSFLGINTTQIHLAILQSLGFFSYASAT